MRTNQAMNMRKAVIVILSVLFVSFSFYVTAQEKGVEVPVRVLLDGKPVVDLQKADFAVFENNKKVEIKDVVFKQKNLVEKEVSLIRPRTFVLAFSILYHDDMFENAVNHLFKNVFKETDRLIVFINDNIYQYPNLKESEEVKLQLSRNLRDEGLRAGDELSKFTIQIQKFINAERKTLSGSGAVVSYKNFSMSSNFLC